MVKDPPPTRVKRNAPKFDDVTAERETLATPKEPSPPFDMIVSLEQAHREELERQRLENFERIRQVEGERLKAENKYEELEDAHADLAERFRTEVKQLTAELVAAKDAAQQSALAVASVEIRLVQIEALRDVLDGERRAHHEMLQSVRERFTKQERECERLHSQRDAADVERSSLAERYRDEVKQLTAEVLSAKDALLQATLAAAAAEKRVLQTEAQRDVLDGERRTLHETLQSLRERYTQQEREAGQLKTQRDSLAEQVRAQSMELQTERTALHSLQAQYRQQEEAAAQLKVQRETLDANRRLVAEQLRTVGEELCTERASLKALSERHKRQELEADQLNMVRQKEAQRYAASLGGLSAQLSGLQQEMIRYRSALVEAEKRADAAKQTVSFRLGYALTHSTKSWDGMLRLPSTLLELRRDAQRRRKAKADKGHTAGYLESRANWLTELEALFARQGLAAAEAFARAQGAVPTELAAGFTRLARLELRSNAQEALRLARESVQLDPRPFRRKWLAFVLFDAGHITEAHELLLSLPHDEKFKSSERFKADFIAGCRSLLLGDIQIPDAPSTPAFEVEPKRILYVASSSLPYHVSGYTSRTQGIVQAIGAQGWDVVCVTRPGYPDDRSDAHGQTPETIRLVDGVRYEMLPGPYRRKTPPDRYLLEAADIIAKKAREERPALIQAASNYEAAIPALIAARTLGIPFVYEVRGLWEYTADSKIPGWGQTERFALDRQLETRAATGADHVLTLTQALSDELQARGVPRSRIELAPNAIDPGVFVPIQRDISLAESLGLDQASFVIGYVGSVLAYEGLDDLVTAFEVVVKQVHDAKLLIVGDGDAMPSLRSHVKALSLEAHVVFAGKVPPDQVRRYFSLLDVVALPRKPFKVCQLVSPLKPLEAMAMGIPLVVSDVAALKEMVRENESALVHKSGDPASLAEALLHLANDRPLRDRLSQAARQQVLATGTWDKVAARISRSYSTLTRPSPKRPTDSPASAIPVVGQNLPPLEQENPRGQAEAMLIPIGRSSMTEEEKTLFDRSLDATVKAGGVQALEALVEAQVAGRPPKFVAFCQLRAAGAALANGHIDAATRIADRALKHDSRATSVRGTARVYYNAALFEKAKELVNRLEGMIEAVSEGDRKFIDEVRGRAELAAWATEPAASRCLPVVKGRVLNVLAFSLPYTSVGYATRSHGLAIGIKNAGWDIRPYTRPGFPYDFKPELEGQTLPEQDEIDGITYRRMFDIERRGMNEVEYLHAAVTRLTRVIEHEQPEVVHAASNYVTALPALIAARRLGVPFVYEMRGFWEVTRSSRDEAFENTPKYRFMQLFEGLVARQADHVITITTAMKEELLARGVPEDNISIAFNSVDPSRFVPRAPNRALGEKLGIPPDVPVIGYVGSFVDYEGLDDLITAAAGLKKDGHDFRLLLVGDGAVFESLRAQVQSMSLVDKVILTGRVPHDEVEDYYSLIDIAPFPRKPWEVCELVSPLKPFEAMALKKAVVVSSTRALMEIVDHERTGLVFEKGNVDSLRHVLDVLIRQPEMRRNMGKTAREWIVRERSWDAAGKVCSRCYALLGNLD